MAVRVKCSNPACGREFEADPAPTKGNILCPVCRKNTGNPALVNADSKAETAVTARPPHRDPLVGRRLAHYEILSRLGHGGMGVVYRARNLNLNRIVALKILQDNLLQESPSYIPRFLQEAQAAAAIKHPNVVTIYHAGESGGRLFIEMEYVEGGTLADAMNRVKRLSPRMAAHVVRDCAAALSVAHEKGIIHRDVKPGNILLEAPGTSGPDMEDWVIATLASNKAITDRWPEPPPLRAKLCDFGLARFREGGKHLTDSGVTMGTWLYLSPEQAKGLPADHRSDIYSLGCIFFELVTGQPPFNTESAESLLYQHVHERPPFVRELAPDVPAAMAAVIEHMMEKLPVDRFQTAAEVVAELDGALAHKDEALIAVTPRRKNRAALYFAGVLLLILAAYAFHFVGNGHPLLPAPDRPLGTNRETSFAQAVHKQSPAPSSTPLSGSPAADYVTTAGTGEKIPHPLSTKTYIITSEGKEVRVPEGMVYVPSGVFQMGEDRGEKETGLIRKEVWLDSCFIGKYEVTNAEYQAFVAATQHPAPTHWMKNGIPEGKENHPVVWVSWFDAKAYCDWVSKNTGRVVRLPTEAEWEKAASWGAERKHQNLYPWGDEWDPKKCNNCYALGFTPEMGWPQWWERWSRSEPGQEITAEGGNTTAVGAFKGDVSAFGCHDMASNVWEWVSDWYQADYYEIGPSRNPIGPEKGERRVMRGGMWRDYEDAFRCVHRHSLDPSIRNFCFGFRCAETPRSAPAAPEKQ